MNNRFEQRFLQNDNLITCHPRFERCNQYIFDTRSDYALSVVDEYDIDGSKKGLYEIAKIKQGSVLNDPKRNLTVDEILEIVNKENEYGNVETKR